MKRLLLCEIEPLLKEKGDLIFLFCFSNYLFLKSNYLSSGAIGSARAKQVEYFCLKVFYRFLASCMNKRHFKLFLFFHSILMINNNNKNTAAKLNKQLKREDTGLDREGFLNRVFKMLGVSLKENEIQTNQQIESTSVKRPEYLSQNSWTNFVQLEKFAPSIFKDISRSLSNNSKKWMEYFKLSKPSEQMTDITDKEIDLINQSPLSQELSLIEKLAVWMCGRPDKINDIVTKFNIYNLGGLIPSRVPLDLKTAYNISIPTTPILITVPKNGKYFLKISN